MRPEDVRRVKEAFAKVVRDLAQLEYPTRVVEFEVVEGDDENYEYLRIAWTTGSRKVGLFFYFDDPDHADAEDDTELLVRLADHVQEQVSYGAGDLVWPVCVAHNFGLHPEVRDGVAVWVCHPHDHIVSAIGELA